MDFSPAEGSTSHILLLSDSIVLPSNSNSDTDVSTDTSIAATPQESGTPTGTVVVNSRDRSGTIIARPIWDHIPTGAAPNPATATVVPFQTTTTRTRRLRHHRELPPESPSNTSRPDTETEDDGDIDMDRMDLEEDEEEEEDDSGRMDSDVPSASASASASPSPERSEIHQLPPHHHHHHHRHHLARHGHAHTHNRGRRAVGIVSDEPTNGPQTLQVDGGDAHIIINEAGGGVGGVEVGVGVGPVRVGEVGVGVEDGIVSLEPNDDFAMGAPPGAPGAIGEGLTPRGLNLEGVGRRRNRTVSGVTTATATGITGTTGDAPDATPRAAVIGLPMMAGNNGTIRGGQQQGHQRQATIRARPATLESPAPGAGPVIPTATAATSPTITTTHPTFPTRTSNASASHTPPHHTTSDSGPYRDEDVLLSLQLLAYLSKYPHVRQAFYKPRVTFHPASVELGGQRFGIGNGEGKEKEKGRKEKERKGERDKGLEKEKEKEKGVPPSTTTKETVGGSFKAFTNAASSLSSTHLNTGAATSSRGKERAQLNSSSTSTLTVMAQLDPSSSTPAPSTSTSKSTPPSSSTPASTSPRQTNVFSLVERFTFKPSSTETDLPNPPPRLPPEIQYWAGVIMRNACRKDDSRGGIRQCANSKVSLFLFSFMGADELDVFLVICGKWESYPREFAKCRRCRKAKYCGKECQSTAWSEGHRFWCSAKDVEEDVNAVTVGHGSSAGAAVGVVGHAGDHMQVQVQQQDQGDHGDLPGIHITADNMGDGNVPITTATGAPTPTLTTTRPERRRHGMGHVVGDGDVSTTTNRQAAAPGPYGHGLSGPGTTGAARVELGMSRDRNVQTNHHHGVIRQRPAIRPPTNTVASDSGPSPTTTGTATAANNYGILQQQQQQQDPMNASHLSFHIQSTTTSSSSASSLTTEQRRAREQQQQQQQQQPRFVLSRRRVDTVTGVSGSSSISTSNSTTTSASLTPSQRAMVQAQLHLQEVPPNAIMSVAVGGHHHHLHHNHQRNQYQTQTQTQAGSSSSSVVGDWSMGSPVHTPLSSSSSSSSSAAAALVSRLEPGPSSSRRHHRMMNPMTRSPPLSAPLTTVSSGSRQKVYRRQGPGHDDNGDRGEDEGDEYDYEDQEGLGDDDMVLG